MNILITGAAGYPGGRLAACLCVKAAKKKGSASAATLQHQGE